MFTKETLKKNAKRSTKIGEKRQKGDETFNEKKGSEKPTKRQQKSSKRKRLKKTR